MVNDGQQRKFDLISCYTTYYYLWKGGRRKNKQGGQCKKKQHSWLFSYSLVPKESNVTLVPHITFIRPNTLLVKAVMTLFWVNTKRKTVMTLIRIVLLSNGCAVITLFKIYLKRVMTDPFTFECHYSLLDHVKLKLQSWLSFGVTSFISVLSWLSLGTTHNPSVLPLLSFRTCLSFGTRE